MANETVEIIEQDRLDAENFLVQVLSDKVPNGDFGKGDALRDFSVTAMSVIFAFLRREVDNVKKHQSLLLLQDDTGTDVDQAVDEILSNFFITRKTGRKSMGTVTLYFSQKPDSSSSVTVPTDSVFFKSSALPFLLNSDTALVYGASSFAPVADTTGAVTSYAIRVPVIALNAGSQYDVEAGPFVSFPKLQYAMKAENTAPFSGGASTESTADMIKRATTAISERSLNSPRAIDATLKNEFTTVDDLKVFGFGTPEMIRDLVTEEGTAIRLHTGGFTDVYLKGPITESSEFTGEIGGVFSDQRPGYYIFRDSLVDFEVENVAIGDVLHIYNNRPSEASEYIIKDVTPKALYVSRRSQFPRELPEVEDAYTDGVVSPSTVNRFSATNHTFVAADVDKWVRIYDSASGNDGTYIVSSVASPPDNYAMLLSTDPAIPDPITFNAETGINWELLTTVVEYSAGIVGPAYAEKVARRVGGAFTKIEQRSGVVVLPPEPIYRIREVYIEDSTDPELSVSGRITFLTRANTDTPAEPKDYPADPLDPDRLQYRVLCRNPEEAFSGWQLLELLVSWPEDETKFDGKTLHVVYDTLTGYNSTWEFMLQTDQRLACASVIPKGLHPVYLSMNIRYATAKMAIESLDTAAAAQALAAYINDFDVQEDFDISDVAAFLRTTYGVIGYIAPIVINYDLIAPDGRVIHYQTKDTGSNPGKIVIDADHYHPDYLMNDYDKLDDPLVEGVSSNTLRFLASSDMITFEAI